MTRLVILDRDGVINFDSKEFIKSPDEWRAIPHSLEAIVKLNQAGFIVCVATNQSGVGRGLFSLETLHAIHAKMQTELSALGGHIDGILFCPHKPEDLCACRKPKPSMMFELLEKYAAAPQETWVVGDALRDLEAGEAAGCKTILVKTGKGEETFAKMSPEQQRTLRHAEDLNHALRFII